MKLQINRDQLRDNPYRLLRRFGYGFIRDRKSGSESLVKRLGSGFYPRFHIYVEEEKDSVIFSLHLDHKQATHYSPHRHNAEYQGEMVEKELKSLKSFIYSRPSQENSPEKKGWLVRLLGKSEQ